jgi:hypothetical protein
MVTLTVIATQPQPVRRVAPQSRQSARIYLQSSEFSPPPPHLPASVGSPPPPMVPEGTHSRAGERAGGAKSDEGTDTLIL